MTAIECVNCRRPVADSWYLCHSDNTSCTALTFGHLDLIRRVLPELEVTVTRRDKLGEGTGRSTEAPLPFNEDAAAVADRIHRTLTGLALQVRDHHGLTEHDPHLRLLVAAHPSRTGQTAAAAHYLKAHLGWIRTLGFKVGAEATPFALVAYRGIEDAARSLARATDARPALMDLGGCGNPGCGGRLLAAHGDRYARCRGCGWVASVAETIDLLGQAARDHLMTVSEITLLLSKRRTDGRSVKRGTVGSWASRGLLPRKGTWRGAGLYLLGDALDLADRLQPATTTVDTESETISA